MTTEFVGIEALASHLQIAKEDRLDQAANGCARFLFPFVNQPSESKSGLANQLVISPLFERLQRVIDADRRMAICPLRC
jgi:hypothetical protein